MPDEKDLPLPDPELPKPEEDLPLPEKEITSGKENIATSPPQNSNQATPVKTASQTENKESKSHSMLVILLLIFLYPIGMILMWFMTKWPKWIKILLTLPFILGIIGMIIGIFTLNLIASNDLTDKNLPPNEGEQVFCTQEAKLCPDGVTYVGREGPNCEFAKCPELEPGDAEVTPETEDLENIEEITEEPLPTQNPNEVTP